MKVVIAIPHIGSIAPLTEFLNHPAVSAAHKIYVLDDNTDENILKTMKVPLSVELVRSTERLFPTKSRNRMLNLDGGDVILFIDNDMDVHTSDFISKIAVYFQDNKKLGILSGQVKRLNGLTDWFSYGKFLSPFDMKHLDVWTQVAWKYRKQKEIFDWTVQQAGHLCYDFWTDEIEKEVDWVYEGFFAIRTPLFKDLNGFDEKFKMFHDGPDLCLRVKRAGYKVLWTPTFQITHKKIINIENEERNKIMENATRYWYNKHFSINEDIFERLVKLTFTS